MRKAFHDSTHRAGRDGAWPPGGGKYPACVRGVSLVHDDRDDTREPSASAALSALLPAEEGWMSRCSEAAELLWQKLDSVKDMTDEPFLGTPAYGEKSSHVLLSRRRPRDGPRCVSDPGGEFQAEESIEN